MRKDSEGNPRFSDDLVGYQLVGGGDEIGKIDHASFDGSWATVTVGRLSKSRYAVPAWAIETVEPQSEIVEVAFAKDDVLDSPEYESGVGFDDAYKENVSAHYRGLDEDAQLKKIA